MDCCKIGLIQMLVQCDQLETNLNHAAQLLAQAKAQGADCVVLPECFDLGWASATAQTQATTLSGQVVTFLCQQAMAHQLYLVAGFTERCGQQVFNASVLVSKEGTLLGHHRKISLVPGVEDTIYSVGDQLNAYETPFGRVAIPICADNLMPSIHIGRTLGDMGVKLVLSPCAWAVPPERYGWAYGEEWYTPYQALAKEYGMTVMGVSNVGAVGHGSWQGYPCIGNSIICAPPRYRHSLPYGEDAEGIEIYTYKVQ